MGVGEGAAGLTMQTVVVTDVVWTHVAVTHTAAAAAAELTGWLTVVLGADDAVLVAGVIAQEAGGDTVFITELTPPAKPG